MQIIKKLKLQKLLLIYSLIISHTSYASNLENIKTTQSNGIALTFDACGGETDWKLLNFVVENKIPVTLFVTSKWIRANPEAINYIKKNNDFFQLENHGENHYAAVLKKTGPYHLKTVLNEKGLSKEVTNAQLDIKKYFNQDSHWYRTAGALYDQKSLEWLKTNNYKIGGYSIAADFGATATKNVIVANLKKSKEGDVILMHINKPNSHVFEGFKEGFQYLDQSKLVFLGEK